MKDSSAHGGRGANSSQLLLVFFFVWETSLSCCTVPVATGHIDYNIGILPRFIALCFIELHRYYVSYKLKVCGNPALSDDGWHFF